MALSLKETFYISHGSPMLAIDDSIEIRKVLKSWKNIYPQTPSAILIISAHWDTRVPSVNIIEKNDTIHDFYGFPKPLYQAWKKELMTSWFHLLPELALIELNTRGN
ncbi:hypothetical protein S245_049041 [Arachis hypogaea]